MERFSFEVDDIIKDNIRELKNLRFIEVNEITLKVLNEYKSKLSKQIETINELKKREIDIFSIGGAASEGICLVDSDGIVTAINSSYTEITGIEKEEIIGKSIQVMVDKGVFTNAVSIQVLSEKKKVTCLSTNSKNKRKVLITGDPVFGDDGGINQVLVVVRDLTELARVKNDLEEMERKNAKYLNKLNYIRTKNRESIVSESKEIKKLKELINYVAKTDTTVLITGETGCGKEVFSREIHNKSDRKNSTYIKINCAAIPESLIESELFGYEKGAFTGALNKEKLGMFEIANGGTILLDEIGEMPLNLQSKLLRVLQEKEIMRIGGRKSIKLDVRVIAATNQDLVELIKKGKFREDLYYRLNVVPIKIPPLRERKEDISILAYGFLEEFNVKYGKDKGFDSTAIQALESYDWPGNVRELGNVIERLIVVNDKSYITYTDIMNILSKDKMPPISIDNTLTLRQAVNRVEKEMIEKALKKFGSTHKAASALGVTQPTVSRKAKALGIKL